MNAPQTTPTRELEERYEIIRKIGEGASAETWLARDLDNGGEQVVIKSLHVEKLDGWKFFELFEREAKTLAALKHAGIPDFIEWFATKSDDGRPRFHIVQEFIEGRSLEDIIEDGGMSEAEFDQLALGMLDILHYLHNRTPPVYHRDIKPSNIVVGVMGSPVLIDFGSVRNGWRAEEDRGSTVAGTHGYMPPEQYMGQVSARSDLYGLGATLLHVASGRDPSSFSFDDGRINVPDDLPVRPAVRKALDAMLEPAPRDRPQSAREARELLVASTNSASTALVPVEPASTALAKRGADKVVRLRAKNATVFVDLGGAPRSPTGEFADVYRSLCPPFLAITTGAEGVNRAGAHVHFGFVFLFLVLLVSTFGFWILIKLIGSSERKRRHALFVHGEFTVAEVVAVTAQNQMSSRVTYDFDVGGKTMRSSCLVANTDASHMLAGDQYGVLYEVGKPSNNTIVYR